MATTPYLDLAGYKLLSLLPGGTIDRVESETPGYFAENLLAESADIDSRLSKRYAAPFVSPYPKAVQRWLARKIDGIAVFKSGFKPTDESALKIDEREKAADLEIDKAADAEKGLYELPLRADTDANGVVKGAPLAYTETSPYVGRDQRGMRGRREDCNRRGTSS